jgi:F-type H+-transporting ATPase subunit f
VSFRIPFVFPPSLFLSPCYDTDPPAPQTGNSGATLTPLVDFYSKLPKGSAPARFGGLKGRFFSGKNASGAPVLALIGGIFLIGYTLDYQRASCSFLKAGDRADQSYPLSSSYWYRMAADSPPQCVPFPSSPPFSDLVSPYPEHHKNNAH